MNGQKYSKILICENLWLPVRYEEKCYMMEIYLLLYF